MSEQNVEKTVEMVDEVDTAFKEEAVIPDVVETPVELAKPQPVIVMPTKVTMGQKLVDTAATMVCGVIITTGMNLMVNGVKAATHAGFSKLKEGLEARKEKKLAKKAEKEAAKLKAAAEAQEAPKEEQTPETEEN